MLRKGLRGNRENGGEWKTNKKLVGLGVALVCIGVLLGAFIMISLTPRILNLHGETGVNFTVGSIHATITIMKDGVVILKQYHAGAVTTLGMNVTLGKLTGDDWYPITAYLLNTTYISIGNQGTLTQASVVLPGEWNRTLGVVEDQAYNSFNLTCTFYPDVGPYTADCIGLNYDDAGNNLWGYDTFTEVTGIDDTFTINVEFKVTVS